MQAVLNPLTIDIEVDQVIRPIDLSSSGSVFMSAHGIPNSLDVPIND